MVSMYRQVASNPQVPSPEKTQILQVSPSDMHDSRDTWRQFRKQRQRNCLRYRSAESSWTTAAKSKRSSRR